MKTAFGFLGAALVAAPFLLKLAQPDNAREHQLQPDQVAAGLELFEHEWQPDDPLSPGGDGLGPVFNETSCVACHHQARPGGGGPNEFNVTAFTIRAADEEQLPRQGVVHTFATGRNFQERLPQVHPDLPEELPARPRFPAGVNISERNTPALFGARLIDELPDRVIIAMERQQQLKWGLASPEEEDAPVGRALRLKDDRVGRFGWKGQTASLEDFVRAACANELGLGNPTQQQPQPLGVPGYEPPGLDLTDQQCDQITTFVASLPRPVERVPESEHDRDRAAEGKRTFGEIGCADCHAPDVGEICGIYSDLLLHRMGRELQGGGSYDPPPEPEPSFDPSDGPEPSEWRTPPLWGVADSAPYLHDGRAATLQQAIELHGGQGGPSARRFRALGGAEQSRLIAFLKTLRAPGQTSEKRR